MLISFDAISRRIRWFAAYARLIMLGKLSLIDFFRLSSLRISSVAFDYFIFATPISEIFLGKFHFFLWLFFRLRFFQPFSHFSRFRLGRNIFDYWCGVVIIDCGVCLLLHYWHYFDYFVVREISPMISLHFDYRWNVWGPRWWGACRHFSFSDYFRRRCADIDVSMPSLHYFAAFADEIFSRWCKCWFSAWTFSPMMP